MRWIICDDCGTEYAGNDGDACPQCEMEYSERMQMRDDEDEVFRAHYHAHVNRRYREGGGV